MKKLESGRSMVEMLGVLAIIGVLSVGGIAGYSLAMRRHRANGVADITTKYALSIFTQCQQKILNGTGVSSGTFTGCISNAISFESADLGPIPSGVLSFGHNDVGETNSVFSETVAINVSFTDKKLCQAFASTVGSPSDCTASSGSNPSVTVYIKNN